MDRVSFTLTEAQWFARNVTKMKQLLEASARKDKGVLERTTYKTLAAMSKKAEAIKGATKEPVDILLPRKQKIVLRDLIGSVLRNLVTQVIPEYQRRADGVGDIGETDYTEYLENAKAKAIALEKLARKLK